MMVSQENGLPSFLLITMIWSNKCLQFVEILFAVEDFHINFAAEKN